MNKAGPQPSGATGVTVAPVNAKIRMTVSAVIPTGKISKSPTGCLGAVFVLVLLWGCTVAGRIQGEHYLRQERYLEGAAVFEKKLREDPFDITANYYMGRYLLALDRPGQALKYFKEAAELDYYNADYHYWLGNCRSALNHPKAERASYRRALELDPDHIPARLDLGHSYLAHGSWGRALACYDEVLARRPDHPQALYNRALALNRLNRRSAEIEAWLAYLKLYPQGKWAIRAVDHLNEKGNFSYRNYGVGNRRIPLERIGFEKGTDALTPAAVRSLEAIGSVLSINRKIHLRIVAHEKGSVALARRRAARVRDYLINNHPVIDPRRLDVDASAVAEKKKAGANVFALKSSVNIITTKK